MVVTWGVGGGRTGQMGDRNGNEILHCRSFHIFKVLSQATVLPMQESCIYLFLNVKGFSK